MIDREHRAVCLWVGATKFYGMTDGGSDITLVNHDTIQKMKDEGTRFGPRLVKSGVSIGFELATGLRCNHVADLYTVTAYLRTT